MIREIRKNELAILKDMLYDVIYQPESQKRLPEDVIYQPELYIYIENFGKKDDCCLVAEIEGIIVGTVWTRILNGEVKGFGNIDNETPEFAIAVKEEYRKKGIGIKLMQEMVRVLTQRGYKQTSLSVAKANYALEMYRKLGFEIVRDNKEDYLMVRKLNDNI